MNGVFFFSWVIIEIIDQKCMKHAMNNPFNHSQLHDPVCPACEHTPQCIHFQRHVRGKCLKLWEQTFKD